MQRIHPPVRSRAAAALAGGLLLTLLLAGCRSDYSYYQAPTPTAPPPTPTAEGGSALALERFHYVASLTVREKKADGEASEVVVSTEGDFQSPDRHAFTYTIQLAGGTIGRSVVIIGQKAWLRLGDEPWREGNRDDPEVSDLLSIAFSALRPGFLGGPEFHRVRESVRRLPPTEESANGVPANRYQVGSPGREFFESFLADEELRQKAQDFDWELWLAQDGAWPVRLLASATITADLAFLNDLDLEAPTYWQLRIDISRPNDPTLAVVAPEEGN